MIVLALCVFLVLAALRGEPLAVALIVVALAADVVGALPALCVALACVVLQEYLVAALVTAALVTHRLGSLGALLRKTKLDPDALAQEVSALPAPLFAELRAIAGEGALTTRDLVQAAGVEEGPSMEGRDPGPGAFDGPLLPDGRGGLCSQYAAEAIALARLLCTQLRRPLNLRLLAICAGTIPLSAAAEWATGGRSGPELDEGLDPDQMVRALFALTDSPAGGDLLRRVEIVEMAPAGLRGERSRADLAGLTRVRMVTLRILLDSTTAFAWVAVLAPIPLDLVRWLLGLPAGALRTVRRVIARARSARDRDVRPVPPERPRLLAAWDGWPADARIAWLIVRPALALAAVVLAVVLAGPVGLLVAPAAMVRPLRRRPLAWLTALAVVPVCAPAAALLAVRALLGELVLLRLGLARPRAERASARGLDRVLAARLHICSRGTGLEVPEVGAARAAYDAAAATGKDGDEVAQWALCYGLAAWAQARPLELLRAMRLGLTGVLFGQWAGAAGHTDAFAELRRLAMQEAIVTWAARWSVLGLAVAVAALAFPHGSGLLGEDELLSRIGAAVATMLIAAPLSRRRRSVFGGLIGLAVGWVLLGAEALPLAAIALIAALLARELHARAGGFVLVGRSRWHAWPLPRSTPLRLRRHWRVADAAIDAGREGIGIELLRSLVERGGSDELAAVALGRVALLEIERGELESAAATLEQIATDSAPSPPAAVATGMLAAELGDLAEAELRLSEGLEQLDGQSPLAPRATLQLADVLGRRGRPDEAISLLARLHVHPFAVQGIDAWVETEVAIAAALAALGKRQDACARLDELLANSLREDLTRESRGRRYEQVFERLVRAEGRGLVLRGRLALDADRPGEAKGSLQRALNVLSSAEGGALRATAQVLFGVASLGDGDPAAAVESVRIGVEEMERRRTQLSAADRRTAMIVADEQLYAAALECLSRADRLGVEDAGVVGAILIESLRRNAIAGTLQAGRLKLEGRALALTDRIAVGERTQRDVDDLRAELGREVSRRFADAYLPRPVTAARLRATARRYGHVLSFFFPPGEMTGWRAWIAPDGAIGVDQIELAGEAAVLLVDTPDGHGFDEELIHAPWVEHTATWDALAATLLPSELRTRIASAPVGWPERILVIPDGVVSLVPWGALRVGGFPLVEGAVVQVLPTLELTPESGARHPAVTDRVVAHVERLDEELEALAGSCSIKPVPTRDLFVAALRSGGFGGTYLAMHGRETGLRQHVEFSDGSTLSAATALGYHWPAWVIFATCLVGRVQQVAGQEPLGLAISCILGGADTVLASVLEITDDGAASVCGAVAARLAAARNPADALRDAQLDYLQKHTLASAASCLGLVCISSVTPTALSFHVEAQSSDSDTLSRSSARS
jgi:tetratricopeptide (TPR) repeat protein